MNIQALRKILVESGGSVTFKIKGLTILYSFTDCTYVNKPLLLINGYPQKRTDAYGSVFTNFISKNIKDIKVKTQILYLLFLSPSYTFNFEQIQVEPEIISQYAEMILLCNIETS